GMAPAPGSSGDTSLLGSATVWPLKRYGRFLPPKDGDHEGQSSSWKVFESDEDSGPLVLTIVESGHFFISQGRAVLEGFSLIDSHKWLKIVRRADCLLFCAQAKQSECRMFRVQFGGSCREEMQEHCCSCVHKLSQYIPVQGAEEQSLSQDTQAMDTEHAVSDPQKQKFLPAPDEPLPDSCTSLGERRSVAQLAQWALRQRPALPLALWQPGWSARELGPFIRLCLMDQHFPAFVEDVEKELHRLAEE
ncbi:RE114 protein, partial [Erithacus rubecula]|nr:RE114 protein [Erithacus rubecula]